jgi:hypothetical protein
MRKPSDCANEPKERGGSVGVVGKYLCSRCGWRWTPRPNSPDPPRACARCRSAYWQSAPVSSRANSPDDPKWLAERESVAGRKQKRHLARLRELAAEFGLEPPPIGNGIAQAPVFPLRNKLSRSDSISVDTRLRFNHPAATQPAPAPSIPATPQLSLSERLRRARAEWESNSESVPPRSSGWPALGPRR